MRKNRRRKKVCKVVLFDDGLTVFYCALVSRGRTCDEVMSRKILKQSEGIKHRFKPEAMISSRSPTTS
jgi:hypothetical protein